MTGLWRIGACAVLAVMAVAAPAQAAGVVSRDGSSLVFQGSDGPDAVGVGYYEPPVNLTTVPSYVFRHGYTPPGADGSITAGSGCESRSFPGFAETSVICDAAGIDHVELLGGGGDDQLSAGLYTAFPASLTARGGPGNDSALGDERAPSGDEVLIGDEGDDTLQAFSHDVASTMSGGPGADNFIWEGTGRGVPTSADGGPGDDRFDTRNALGPDTITGGGGADAIRVFDAGRGDPDTVRCAGSRLAELKRDAADVIAADCVADPLAASRATLEAQLRRLALRDLVRRGSMRLAGIGAPGPGSLSATLRGAPPAVNRVLTLASGRRDVTRAGATSLLLSVPAKARAVLRRTRRVGVTLVVRFAPADGSTPRGVVAQGLLR